MDSQSQTSNKKRRRNKKRGPNSTPPTPTGALYPPTGGSSPVLSPTISVSDSFRSLAVVPREKVCRSNYLPPNRCRPSKVGSMVSRPGFGKLGRPIDLYCNAFNIQFQGVAIHQYDVDIQPVQRQSRPSTPLNTIMKLLPGGGGRGRGRGRGRGGRGGRGGRAAAPQGPVKIKREELDLIYKAVDSKLPVGASFDGEKILYIPGRRIQDGSEDVSITVDDKRKNFRVAIKWTASFNTSDVRPFLDGQTNETPNAVTAALTCALVHVATMKQTNFAIRGAVFKLDNLAKMINPGIQTWAGYTQHVRPCQNGLVLNINSCFAPMVKSESVFEFIHAFVNSCEKRKVSVNEIHRYLDDRKYAKMASSLNKLKAKTTYNPRREKHVKIFGFTNQTAAHMMIPTKRGQISVAQYYHNEYGVALRNPHLRMVTIFKKNEMDPKNFYPPEVMHIKGVPYRRRKLTDFELETLIKAATLSPKDKMDFINSRMAESQNNRRQQEHLQQWGIKIDKDMMQLVARVLPGPTLEGANQVPIDVEGKGFWEVDKLFVPIPVKSWAFVNFSQSLRGNPMVTEFINQMMAVMNQRGMTVSEPPCIIEANVDNMFQSRNILGDAANRARQKFKANCQIILVMMPNLVQIRNERYSPSDLRTEIKVASDQHVGVPSQCMLDSKAGLAGQAARNFRAYLYNIVLKINAKLGGINSVLKINQGIGGRFPVLGDRPFMVLGADLTHPAPDSDDKRSVIGVVGSLDKTLSRYACRTAFQQPDLATGREVIHNLKPMVQDLLRAFRKNNNGAKPEAILYYRDGVSDGEFPMVVQHEYKAIRDACLEIGDPSAEYCPPITFVTVQKRHPLRFFCKNENDADASGNVPPGGVIDTDVCHPSGFDFYLYGHAGIQGTSRPARYAVLVDEIGFDADGLQSLTYWMCHLFCRCSRSVSYCPPAYYAHHAASRGKLLMTNQSRGVQKTVHDALVDSLFFI